MELIIANALEYNQLNTGYYLDAQKLATVCKYLFGEQYLRYLLHSLPFAHAVRGEQLGLPAMASGGRARTASPALNNRAVPVVTDQPDPHAILNENPRVAE